MRSWVVVGIALTVIGLVMLQKGLTLRFGGAAASSVSELHPSVARTGDEPDRSRDTTGMRIAGEGMPGAAPRDTVFGGAVESLSEVQPFSTRSVVPTHLEHLSRDFNEIYKGFLVDRLSSTGWSREDLDGLRRHLSDRRARFRWFVLRKNVQHVEARAHYDQHLTPESIEMCLAFWDREGRSVVMGASRFDFPVEVVVAVLKVESNFGKWPGQSSIFNVYWSLALADHPVVLEILKANLGLNEKGVRRLARRAEWARRQLRYVVYMSRSETCPDLLEVAGSWAGAFGLCQFVPSSYLAYGRDGDGDGVVDLDDVADASASIAFYLAENGWPKDDDLQKKKRALKRYNHSDLYAGCIIALADSLYGKLKVQTAVAAGK